MQLSHTEPMQPINLESIRQKHRKRIFFHAFKITTGMNPCDSDYEHYRTYLESKNFTLKYLLEKIGSDNAIVQKNNHNVIQHLQEIKSKHSILVLSTYPIENPTHGGQLRVSNIVQSYRSKGHKVQVVGVLGSENYQAEHGFVNYPGANELSNVINNPFLMEDYAIGKLFAKNNNYYTELAKKIEIKPDIIEVEHPWLFEFAARYRKEYSNNSKIFYSSHNIEYKLKQQILSIYLDKISSETNSNLIRDVELHAILNADACICVSENDLQWIRNYTQKRIALAPNGVNDWQSDYVSRENAQKISLGFRYALYCASAHPPNMAGFFEMFGNGFGSMNPDQKLVIVGDAGWSIAGDQRVHQSAKLAEKVVVAGRVDQSTLAGLLDNSHCIILPITQGGGTNLKTAEALWSGKHIVATSIAFRGFEKYIGQNGVNIANTPEDFKKALRVAINADPLKLTNDEIESRRNVLWDVCLSSLQILIESTLD